ncbi:MAG: hypothetical protein QG670_2290 [Thermoproteota archaeon]|nr:hypothetical protein [Thermoproteota archaeon]
MIGIFLALLSAVVSAFSIVLVRRNSIRSNSFNISLIITCVGTIALWPMALLVLSQENINYTSFLLFALSGSLSPGIVRLFYYKGLKRLGASVNSSVFSIYPLYSALMGIILLSETLSSQNWIGIACIFLGVVTIQLGNRRNSSGEGNGIKSLVYPVLAGVTIAFGSVIGKLALEVSNVPILGVAIAYTFSLVPYVIIMGVSSSTRRELHLRRDLRFFWGSGIGQAICWMLTFVALQFEQVSLVNPLLSTEPLFVILLTFFLLREIESVSRRVVAGIVLIVAGVILVAL